MGLDLYEWACINGGVGVDGGLDGLVRMGVVAESQKDLVDETLDGWGGGKYDIFYRTMWQL